MMQAILSANYRVTIPRKIHEQFNLRPGQRIVFLIKGAAIHLIPDRRLAELRGIARNLKPGTLREKPDR